MIWLCAFLASFVFVGLRATQQLNVQHNKYWWVVPTSLAMAVCEVFIITQAAQQGWGVLLVLAIGLGAGLGCLLAMYLHKRLRG